ncbi:MAG TPA: hypothetical protein VHU23_01905 [Rhizomicrobium sp.]|jgi:hypothetical protein|nr:hypothetical protein [Rhizomicrobium sp.]
MHNSVVGDGLPIRARSPDAWRYSARILDAIGYGIGLWLLLWPEPYKFAVVSAMTAFLAALAIEMLLRQRLGLADPRRGDQRPRIQMLFVMPALALALRALLDINLLDWRPVLVWSLAPAALLAVPLFAGDRDLPKRPLIAAILLVLNYAYSWGAIVEANSIFDTSAPHHFQTTIRAMHANRGKSTSYHLVLGPWNGRPAGDDVRVPYAAYAGRRPGDTICVTLSDGWLGFRYYAARSCWVVLPPGHEAG